MCAYPVMLNQMHDLIANLAAWQRAALWELPAGELRQLAFGAVGVAGLHRCSQMTLLTYI